MKLRKKQNTLVVSLWSDSSNLDTDLSPNNLVLLLHNIVKQTPIVFVTLSHLNKWFIRPI